MIEFEDELASTEILLNQKHRENAVLKDLLKRLYFEYISDDTITLLERDALIDEVRQALWLN